MACKESSKSLGSNQRWRDSDETSNPFATQRISNVVDNVDQLLDPTKVYEARREAVEAQYLHAGVA